MKIMYCITNASWGGAQLHVLELCRDQIIRGNEVIFIVGSEGVLLDKVKEIEGVKVILLSSLVREVNVIKDVQVIRDLRKLILKEKPDILHLHSSKAGTVGRIAAINLPVFTVFTVHGWAFTNGAGSNFKKNLYKIVEKIVSPLTNLFICVSEYDYNLGINESVISKKNNNAITIWNGVPRPINNYKKENSSLVRLVMTARFSKQKDQKTLIYALNKIRDLNFHMIFVGEGETFEENIKLVRDLNLKNKIDFVGFKDNVIPFLIQSDIYILSTHYEGLPISVIEAMSYSLPILVTDVGGDSELVDDGINGFLCKSNDINDLAIKLKLLVTDKEKIKSFGENSYKKYYDGFRLECMLTKINEEYKKLLR
jgi:glycosyltransferase involved in cell wall biosynthesis